MIETMDHSVGFVTQVKPDSAASRAGLLYGDMISLVNNQKVRKKKEGEDSLHNDDDDHPLLHSVGSF